VHFPVVLDIGPVAIPAHAVFEIAAYAIAFRTYLALRRRAGDVVDGTARWTTIAAAAVGAAAGSKIVFWLDDPAASWLHRADPEWLLSGKSIVGAILGGWIAVECVKAMTGVTRRTGYLAWRIGIDFLKPRVPALGLSGIQWACVAGIVAVAATWTHRSWHGMNPEDGMKTAVLTFE